MAQLVRTSCAKVQIVERIQGLIVALQGFVETFKMIPLEREQRRSSTLTAAVSQSRVRALGSSGQALPEEFTTEAVWTPLETLEVQDSMEFDEPVPHGSLKVCD